MPIILHKSQHVHSMTQLKTNRHEHGAHISSTVVETTDYYLLVETMDSRNRSFSYIICGPVHRARQLPR